MKINKIFLSIFAGLVVAITASFFTLNWYKNTQQKLIQAQSLLGEFQFEKAKTAFTKLENSIWVKKQAHLGIIISSATTAPDSIPDILPDDDTVYIQDYHLPELMHKTLTTGQFKQCLRLAKIGKFYKLDAANLYYAASLLETGNKAEALKYYSQISPYLKNTTLGSALQNTFELLNMGAEKVVRDRNGQLIGTVDKNGQFTFIRKGYRTLIQPEIIRDIIANEFNSGIRLSIDLELSSLARLALGHNRGSIVLVEPGTGEILTAICDKNTAQKMGEQSSPPFEQMLEPASISKLITITAAFRKKLNVDREIGDITCRGYKWYSGKILYCPAARGKLFGLNHALSASCNIAFANLAVKVGWEKMLEELRLFGFDSQTVNPFPLGRIIIDQGDDRNLADLGIGLENTVISPVHGALIASVFANQGTWVNPHLFHATDGLTGLSPQRIERIQCEKILYEEWLPAIEEAMWAVTRSGGTAAYIAPIGFPVYMKTGTGGNYRDGFHINYIGYVPEYKENIAFCVRITNKRNSPRARKAGYTTTHQLLTTLHHLSK